MSKEYLRVDCDRDLEDIVDDIIREERCYPEEYFQLSVILNDEDPYYRSIKRHLYVELISYAKTAQIMNVPDREMHATFKEYKYYLDDPIKIRYMTDSFADQYRKRSFDKQYFSMMSSLMGAVRAESERLAEVQRLEDEERLIYMVEQAKIVDEKLESWKIDNNIPDVIVLNNDDQNCIVDRELYSIDRHHSLPMLVLKTNEDLSVGIEEVKSEGIIDDDVEDKYSPFRYVVSMSKEDLNFDSRGVIFSENVSNVKDSSLISDQFKKHYKNLSNKSNRSQVCEIAYKILIDSRQIKDYRYFILLTTQSLYNKKFRDFKDTILDIDELISDYDGNSVFMRGKFDLSRIYSNFHKMRELVEFDGDPIVNYFVSVLAINPGDEVLFNQPVFKYGISLDIKRLMWWSKRDSYSSTGRIRYFNDRIYCRLRARKIRNSYYNNLKKITDLVVRYNLCRHSRRLYGTTFNSNHDVVKI